MSSHEQPLELEASTTEPARPLLVEDDSWDTGKARDPFFSVDLTVADTASTYGISVSSVRRLLKEGKLRGAHKVPGPKGLEYRIPTGALEALGYSPKQTRAGAVLSASRAEAETEQLSARVRELEASLETERLLRTKAEERAELVERNLQDLRDALSKLPPALPAALPAPRARWWKRSPKAG